MDRERQRQWEQILCLIGFDINRFHYDPQNPRASYRGFSGHFVFTPYWRVSLEAHFEARYGLDDPRFELVHDLGERLSAIRKTLVSTELMAFMRYDEDSDCVSLDVHKSDSFASRADVSAFRQILREAMMIFGKDLVAENRDLHSMMWVEPVTELADESQAAIALRAGSMLIDVPA